MVELYLGGVPAELLDGGREMYGLLRQFHSALRDLGEQVGGRDGAEELAALAGLYRERDGHFRQNLGERLGVFEFPGLAKFAGLYKGFNLLFVGLVYGYRNLLGEEIIAGVSRLDGDLFAFPAQIFDGLYY